jgi:hypothetical protein
MDFQYGQVEAALARVFEVKFEDASAFRARLRHLRNLGVPSVSSPGSGRKAKFERAHAIEMLIALQFEALGLPPRFAVRLTKPAMIEVMRAPKAAEKDSDVMAMILPGQDFASDARAVASVGRWPETYTNNMVRQHQRIRITNLSRAVEALDRELARGNA